MLEYARWKYVLIAVVLALAFLFAVPNLFGDDPALQVATKDHSPVTADTIKTIDGYLQQICLGVIIIVSLIVNRDEARR